jgi:hypothetical protein
VKYYSIANLRSVPRCQHRYGNPRWLLKSRHTGLFILMPVLPNPRHATHAAGSSPINFSVSHHHTRITEEVERTSTSVNKDYCTVSPRTEPIPSFLPNIDLVTIHFTAPLPPSFPRGSQAEAVTPAARTWLIRLVSSRLVSSRLDLDLGPAISFSFIFTSPSPNKIPLSLSTSSVILRFCSDLATQ